MLEELAPDHNGVFDHKFQEEDTPVLYILREAKDVAVSWYFEVTKRNAWMPKRNTTRYRYFKGTVDEFIISRTDISVICAYYIEEGVTDPLDSFVVLVKEFRSPVRNARGFIYELVGGFSFKKTEDIIQTAADELREETGLPVDCNQLEFHGARQMNSTFSTHDAHLFSCRLTKEQFEQAKIAQDKNTVFGNLQDSEMTYIRLARVRDLLYNNEACPIDWSMMGMLLKGIFCHSN